MNGREVGEEAAEGCLVACGMLLAAASASVAVGFAFGPAAGFGAFAALLFVGVALNAANREKKGRG